MKFCQTIVLIPVCLIAFALTVFPSCSKNEGTSSPRDASTRAADVQVGHDSGSANNISNDTAGQTPIDAGNTFDSRSQIPMANDAGMGVGTKQDLGSRLDTPSSNPDITNPTEKDTGITHGSDTTSGTVTADALTGSDTNTVVTVKPGEAINHGVKLEGFGSGTTGGGSANKKTVSSLAELEGAIGSNVTIMVDGTISGSGMVSIKEVANISIIGVGSNGKFRGVGLSFVRTNNIIVQNLSFENSTEDSVNVEDANQVWIDHNTMSTDVNYLDCLSASVKDKYDGQIDIKKNSKNVTVSFNYIHDACKAMLLGFSDGKEPDDLVTYHHNRFENVGSRLPLIRSADTHIYNNYYKNVFISGINVRMGANALIENNFFDTVDDPILSADSDEIGFWNVSGNIYLPNGPSYTHQVEKADVIGTVVNGEVKSTSSWRVNYAYALDKAEDVPATALKYAGAGKI